MHHLLHVKWACIRTSFFKKSFVLKHHTTPATPSQAGDDESLCRKEKKEKGGKKRVEWLFQMMCKLIKNVWHLVQAQSPKYRHWHGRSHSLFLHVCGGLKFCLRLSSFLPLLPRVMYFSCTSWPRRRLLSKKTTHCYKVIFCSSTQIY